MEVKQSQAIKIDINADLGEGAGHDTEIMPLISSCSIACGGHFGDAASMRTTIQLAKKYGVKVGAHPSYPDRSGFGRLPCAIGTDDLIRTIKEQLLDFYSICDSEEIEVNHIKLHGALYHDAVNNPKTAKAVLAAINETKKKPLLYVPYGSQLHQVAKDFVSMAFEAFLDRSYLDDGTLVPRSESNALITSPENAWQQLFSIASRQVVRTVSSIEIPVTASTFCIHGDHPNSIALLQYIQWQARNHSISWR